MKISVQDKPFSLAKELAKFSTQNEGAGAIVNFVGKVRSDTENPLSHMLIEHYAGMTDKAIRQFVEEALSRWKLIDCLVIHRFGKLRPGEEIVLVATSSRHRIEAFEAAEFLMDYLKSRAPFWKKEVSKKGEQWVQNKEADEVSLEKWG